MSGLLYSQLKIFHHMEKLKTLSPTSDLIKPPIHIRLKPTNRCSHNCRYCAYRADNLQLGKDMRPADSIPKEKMIEIINDLEQMGVKALTFSGGGDPFCYPYLLETVQKLTQTSIKFASLTNGARLNGEIAELFSRYATWIRISMDGWDAKSYAQYRHVSDNEFGKVMKNLENFKKLGGPCYLGVSVIVDQMNAPHLYTFIEKIKDTGADSIKISPCIVSNSGKENNLYHESIFHLVKEQIHSVLVDLKSESFEIYDAYHELDEKFTKSYQWCPYIQILPVIGADLHVYACHDKAYNIENGSLGCISDISFKEFWLSRKAKFFKINPSQHCNHHCVVNSINKMLIEFLNVNLDHSIFV